MTLFFEKLTLMSEGYKAGDGGRGIYSQRTADQEKKGGEGEEEGGKADACLLTTCHISGTGGGTEAEETAILLTTAKLSPTTCGHFSGTSVSGSERAGRWRGQPLSNVDSQPQSEDV